MERDQKKAAVAWLSVISNTVLVILKVAVGLLIGSVSVISEAIHSGVDLLASIIALFAVRTSAKPADQDHPFGHGKFENVSGAIEALLIFIAAAWIIYEAVHKLLTRPVIETPGWGVGVMAISAVANWVVSRMLFKVGKETDSVALQADGWHLRTDVYTSLGVMVGLGLIWAGDLLLRPRFTEAQLDVLHWLDPIAAIVVACLIVHAAWRLTLSSARDLMDVNLPEEERAWIRRMLSEFVPVLHGYHRMRTRKAGHERFIDFHIFVDSRMTVDDSHRLAHEISRRIEEHFEGSSVTVHVEPCRGNCDHGCREGCLLDPQQQQEIRDAKAAEADEVKNTWVRDGSKG